MPFTLQRGITEPGILSGLAAALKAGIPEASVSVALDPEHLQEMLANGPGRVRLILGWNGSSATDDVDHQGGWERGEFFIIVQQHPSLPVDHNSSTTGDRAGGPSLLLRAARVKAFVRGLKFEGEAAEHIQCGGFHFTSSGWEEEPETGRLWNAVRLTFGVFCRPPSAVPAT